MIGGLFLLTNPVVKGPSIKSEKIKKKFSFKNHNLWKPSEAMLYLFVELGVTILKAGKIVWREPKIKYGIIGRYDFLR